MAARRNAVAELSNALVRKLEDGSVQGGVFPTLRELGTRLEATFADADLLKAAARSPLKDQALVDGKDLEAPLAPADQAEALAEAERTWNHLLARTCSAERPACTAADMKKAFGAGSARVKKAFDGAFQRRVKEGRLPAGVIVLRPTAKKVLLHLAKYPLPPGPEEVFADHLVEELERAKGEGSYPLPLVSLLARTRPKVNAKVRAAALKHLALQGRLALAGKKEVLPVALAEDFDLLARSDALLLALVDLARTAKKHCLKVSDLAAKVEGDWKQLVQEAVSARVETGQVPAGLGALHGDRGAVFLFRLEDIIGARAAPAVEPLAKETMGPGEFAAEFEAAFARLDRRLGGHNYVSLVDLRREVPVDRTVFDRGLQELRRAGHFVLGSAEGRGGIGPEEREAGLVEHGALMLYVSRRRA